MTDEEIRIESSLRGYFERQYEGSRLFLVVQVVLILVVLGGGVRDIVHLVRTNLPLLAVDVSIITVIFAVLAVLSYRCGYTSTNRIPTNSVVEVETKRNGNRTGVAVRS